MAVSLATFRARFPEFEKASDPVIQDALDEAERRTDASVFGNTADDRIKWLAAHLVTVSPFGRQARLASKEADSTYMAQVRRLDLESVGPALVV